MTNRTVRNENGLPGRRAAQGTSKRGRAWRRLVCIASSGAFGACSSGGKPDSTGGTGQVATITIRRLARGRSPTELWAMSCHPTWPISREPAIRMAEL